MTQQHDRPGAPVNQFGTPVDRYGTPVDAHGRTGAAASVTPHPFVPAGHRTDPVSIWALVLAIVFWPVGLVLSIVAMVRTGRGGLGGRGLAVAALVICVVHLLLLPVLAAVAIPVFLNQREKAVQASLLSDLRTAQVAMETAWIDTGSYPTTVPATTPLSPGTDALVVLETGAVEFCLRADAGETTLYMDQTGTTSPYGCP